MKINLLSIALEPTPTNSHMIIQDKHRCLKINIQLTQPLTVVIRLYFVICFSIHSYTFPVPDSWIILWYFFLLFLSLTMRLTTWYENKMNRLTFFILLASFCDMRIMMRMGKWRTGPQNVTRREIILILRPEHLTCHLAKAYNFILFS